MRPDVRCWHRTDDLRRCSETVFYLGSYRQAPPGDRRRTQSITKSAISRFAMPKRFDLRCGAGKTARVWEQGKGGALKPRQALVEEDFARARVFAGDEVSPFSLQSYRRQAAGRS